MFSLKRHCSHRSTSDLHKVPCLFCCSHWLPLSSYQSSGSAMVICDFWHFSWGMCNLLFIYSRTLHALLHALCKYKVNVSCKTKVNNSQAVLCLFDASTPIAGGIAGKMPLIFLIEVLLFLIGFCFLPGSHEETKLKKKHLFSLFRPTNNRQSKQNQSMLLFDKLSYCRKQSRVECRNSCFTSAS